MRDSGNRWPGITALQARVRKRPSLRDYLSSKRRLPFNESGIFRHYPELDLEAEG
ncbi:glutathione S-transferase [Pseudorhizobium halotolerans]|uniref:Glutathione S-transferase n=1 Tax=Pseudorhizobium halotolerans TaxID=1233081 RepID=A0ABN7JKU2_9HYPH|nr:glutathione S-transferase [Pseudorhizobium halotolerans]